MQFHYLTVKPCTYEGCSKSNENVGPIWAQGVRSGNTAQQYVVHTRGYQKYKFHLNRMKTWIFVIICVRIHKCCLLFFTFKKNARESWTTIHLKFCVKLGKTTKVRTCYSKHIVIVLWVYNILSLVQCFSR